MKIIRRYYIGEFFKVMGIIALGLAGVFSLLDLVNNIDEFLPGKASVGGFAYYSSLSFPKYLYYLLPTSLLICSLFVFSQASRHKEIVIIKAVGGRLKRLFYPFIVLGIFFSLFGFVLGEGVMPNFSERSIEFKKTHMKSGGNLEFKEGTLWMRGTDNSLVRMGLYIPDKKLARGVSIFIYDQTALKKRIEATEAVWFQNEGLQGVWKLRKVIIYDIEKGAVTSMTEMAYPYLESPDLFTKAIKNPEDMGIGELSRYIRRLKNEGFSDPKLIVDLNSKISFPLTNLFMVLLGISFSVMSRIGGGIVAAGLGIFISIIYWLMYTLVLSMGYARIIPPFVSTWIVAVLFGSISVYLFMKIPE